MGLIPLEQDEPRQGLIPLNENESKQGLFTLSGERVHRLSFSITGQKKEPAQEQVMSEDENVDSFIKSLRRGGKTEEEITSIVESELKGIEKNPLVDPISAGAGGFGGGFVTGGIRRGIASGIAAIVPEAALGTATEEVADIDPRLSIPFAITAGLITGVTLERALEKAILKVSKKVLTKNVLKRLVAAGKVKLGKGDLSDPFVREAAGILKAGEIIGPPKIVQREIKKRSARELQGLVKRSERKIELQRQLEARKGKTFQERKIIGDDQPPVEIELVSPAGRKARVEEAIETPGFKRTAEQKIEAGAFAKQQKKVLPTSIRPPSKSSTLFDASGSPIELSGFLAGVEIDEDGNVTLDAEKATIGLAAGIFIKRGGKVKINNKNAKIKNLLKKKVTISKAKDLISPPPKKFPKYAGSINLNRTDISDQAKDVVLKASKEVPKKKIPWKETEAFGEALGLTPKELQKAANRIGRGKLTGVIEASRQLHVDASQDLGVELNKIANNPAARSDEVLVQAGEAFERYKTAIFTPMQELSSEAGRALAAQRKIIGPKKHAQNIEKVLENMGGRETANEMIDNFKRLDFGNPYEVAKAARNLEIPKYKDLMYEWFYNSILSGPPTHLVNITSNTLWQAYQIPHKAVRSLIDIPVAKLQGRQREHYLSEIVPMFTGMKTGLRKGVAKFFEMAKKGHVEEDLTKWNQEIGSALGAFERSPSKILRGLAPIISFPTRLLRAEDMLFRNIAYDSEINASAMRIAIKEGFSGKELTRKYTKLINNPTKGMLESAGEYADYATFLDAPGKISKSFQQVRDAVPGGRFLLPFVLTPGNLLKRGVEMIPGLGLAIQTDKLKGAELSDVLTKQVMGGSVMAYFASLYLDGRMTGGVPSDKAERDAFFRQGKLPWSIKIGDSWVQYSRIEPFKTVLSSVAVLGDGYAKRNEEPAPEVITAMALDLGRSFLDSSYMAQTADFITAIQRGEDSTEAIQKMISRTTSAFVPFSGLQRSLVRASEAVEEGEATLRQPKGFIQILKSQTPLLSEQVPARLDIWGEPIKFEGVIPEKSKISIGESVIAATRQFLPYKWREESTDPVEIELGRLGDLGFGYPGAPSKVIKGIKLTQEEHNQYVEKSGKWIKKKLDKLLPSTTRSDEAQANIRDEIFRVGRAKFANEIFSKISKERKKKRRTR